MAGSGNIRQQLYDRIRESSKDEVILEEMVRLGYWPRGEGKPSLSEELIKRNGELSRELTDLYAKQARWANPEQAIKEMHKQRKKAAMERRKETKARHEKLRAERAAAWAERRKREILFLGPDVSGGLSKGADTRPLTARLPGIADARALADAIGITMAELRFLAFDRAVSRVSHYQRFLIAKKAGGDRLISAPMPRLKRAQYWVLDNILTHVPVHDAAHGFANGRSILSNATPHVGRDVVVNLDLKDFFPTLTWKRVRGKFRGLGYSEAVATILALICTEPDNDTVELDGQTLHVRRGPRRLPQGAPTSPAVTNLICLRLDRRLSGLATKLGFTYTRYADDMTFSASGDAARMTGTLLKAVGEIVAAEGFTVHPDKTRIMRRHRRQEVTGLTVNERVGVPRDTLRRFRALLHGIEKTGPDGKAWGRGGNVLQAARGFAQFVAMVDGEAGKALVAKVDTLSRRHGVSAPAAPHPDFRAKAAGGQQPLARWWQASEKGSAPDAPAAQGKPGNGAAPLSSFDLLGTKRPTVPQPAPLAAVQAPPAPAQPVTPAPSTQAATPVPAQTPPEQSVTPPPAQAPAAQTTTPAPAPAATTQAAPPAPAQTPPAQPVTPPPAQAQTPPTATSSPAPAASTQAPTRTQVPPAQNTPPRPTPTQAAPEPFRPPLGQQPSPPVQRSGLPKGWWLIPLAVGVVASLAGLPLLWRILAIVVSGLAALFYFRGNGRS
jgi:RNA-directed DNA polymerase